MGPLFVILFWAIIFGSIVVAISLIKDKQAQRGCLLTFGIALLLLVGLIVARVVLNSTPSYVFSDTFGFEASEDIKVLFGDTSAFFDSQETQLIFVASPQVIKNICDHRNMFECSTDQTNLTFSSFLKAMAQTQEFKDSAAIKYYQYAGGEHGRTEVLIYNSQINKAIFCAVKID